MGDLFLTIYVCTYRNMSRSGMLIGMLRVSCWPRRCENYNLEKQISGRARGAPGLAELEQLHMESNSRHLFIPQLHNSLV